MTKDEKFLSDLENWLTQQVTLMTKAEDMAKTENESEAVIRYESRVDAYSYLLSKMQNWHDGKAFFDEDIM